MMVNFKVKSNMNMNNSDNCRVSTQGKYQIFGHEDYLRKRPYSTTCTWIKDGILFTINGVDFERHVKAISEETWNEIIKAWIIKEDKLNKFISVRSFLLKLLKLQNRKA